MVKYTEGVFSIVWREEGKSLTAVVLAGGKSLRLGQDKTSLLLGGQTLLERVLRGVALLSEELIVVVAHPQDELHLPADLAVRKVSDLYPGKGSLGGIYSGLAVASAFHSLVVACDMPFLNVKLLRRMKTLASGYDVVIPRLGGQLEPLHAIYSKNCLEPIRGLLEQGDLRIIHFFPAVRVRYLEEDEIAAFDSGYLSFFNINTLADLEKARLLEVKPAAPASERGQTAEVGPI